MEALTILLSSLFLVGSPSGLLADRLTESLLQSTFDRAETWQVRIDNAPVHRLLQGQAERVRIAGREIWITEDLQIAKLEIETDAIDLNLRGSGDRQNLGILEQPLQAGISIAFTDTALNQWLNSPEMSDRLRQLAISSLPRLAAAQLERYHIINPEITFLDNRIRLQFQLQQLPIPDTEPSSQPFELALAVESGFTIIKGWGLELVDLEVTVNQEPVPPLVINLIQRGVREQFDLRTLESNSVILRLLQMQLTPGQLEIAGFLSVQPPFGPSDHPDPEE
ncbi:DUF2993 domain-containing protein [Roseofilum sp. BLCC_M154]|uniref:DUF2993 domain-containing protein n=1 Tax=Roseofilum acuticapitatum BLCC-M154 TaxID=3022444 RepID=A0ABT7AYF9_9CYAN|nr:DUF2993 domain-containing protein [Roseofilum acuticapitatum]MDJ1171351.1 DUF2993 domain-containing protein [Roseofilum acuticapitatum BLCC-M154]